MKKYIFELHNWLYYRLSVIDGKDKKEHKKFVQGVWIWKECVQSGVWWQDVLSERKTHFKYMDNMKVDILYDIKIGC